MSTPPLVHADPNKPDDRLAAEASAHLSRHAPLQLVAELLTRLREMHFPWWTAEQLRTAYPASVRLAWLAQRPDLRQRITTGLTGLAARAARNKEPEFQASLIDSVIDEGDIPVDTFEAAFEPIDIAVYGPAAELWHLFRQRMPWDDDSTAHKDLVGWLVGALLADKSSLDATPRTPILGALSVRTAIDGRVWHTRIPLNVRVAIDEARFTHQRERPGEPFGVERDLGIATPALIAASVPLKDLFPVLDVAAIALGFEEAAPRSFGREHASKPEPASAASSDDGPRAPLDTLPHDEPPVPEERARDTEHPPSVPTPSMRPPASIRPPASVRPPSMHPPSMHPPSIPAPAHPATVPPPAMVHEPHAISDEPTHEPGNTGEGEQELDHTNPWVVPKLMGDIERAAQELKARKKDSSD